MLVSSEVTNSDIWLAKKTRSSWINLFSQNHHLADQSPLMPVLSTQVMLDAHVTSMIILAMPFKAETLQPVAFGPGTPWADNTAKIRSLIPVMLKHRLTPPPKETYSLNRWSFILYWVDAPELILRNRKLSGAFLLASRLGAKVDTKKLWDNIVYNYQFGP